MTITRKDYQDHFYKEYKKYINELSDEFLLFEFADKTGSTPEEYYMCGAYHEDRSQWIETLMDIKSVELYEGSLL